MNAAPAEAIPRNAVTELRARAGEHRFLAKLLAAPPDRALLADAAALGWLACPCSARDAGWEARIEDHQVEYTRLFAAPGLDAIPVHQSVYTDVLCIEPAAAGALDDGIKFTGGEFRGYLGGESCGELRRWYAAYGFAPPATEMPDHIAVELDFLAHLIDAQAVAAETGNADQADAWRELAAGFFSRFLQRWLDLFAGKVAANTVSVFYRRVGERLRGLDLSLTNQPGAAYSAANSYRPALEAV